MTYAEKVQVELCKRIRKKRPLITSWLEQLSPVDEIMDNKLILRFGSPLASESLKRKNNFAFLCDELADIDHNLSLIILDS